MPHPALSTCRHRCSKDAPSYSPVYQQQPLQSAKACRGDSKGRDKEMPYKKNRLNRKRVKAALGLAALLHLTHRVQSLADGCVRLLHGC